MAERRIKAVQVGRYFWINWMTQGYQERGFEVTKGVPKDAVFLYAYHLLERGCVYFVFEHESFDPVPLNKEIPVMDVELTCLEKEVKSDDETLEM